MGKHRLILGREALLEHVEGLVRCLEDRQIQESITKGVHLNNFLYTSRFDDPESVHLKNFPAFYTRNASGGGTRPSCSWRRGAS